MAKRYRYILSGAAGVDQRVCDFRLVAGSELRGIHKTTAIRIDIPDDMELHYSGDGYSTTDDRRTLLDLNAKAMVYRNGHWVFMQWLLCSRTGDWARLLYEELGLRPTLDRGFLDQKQFARYTAEIAARAPKDFPEAKGAALAKITPIVKAIGEQDARTLTALCEDMASLSAIDGVKAALRSLGKKYPGIDPDAVCDALSACTDAASFLY